MNVGRFAASAASCAAVAACAVAVIGIARADRPATSERALPAAASRTERPAFLPARGGPSTATTGTALTTPAPGSATSTSTPSMVTTGAPIDASNSVPAASRSSTPQVVAPRATAPLAVVPRTTAPQAVAPRTTAPRTTAPRAVAPLAGQKLPLGYSTGTATRVITVTASSARSTTATLQAWTKVGTGRFTKYGSAITAHVGADGIGTASESSSHTPQGSFTLTQAFGRYANPGTSLPYFVTNPSDYWISTAGSRYNTHQRCAGCGYNNGVNERLYYVNPQYNYAVVIDYNTRNSPTGVRAGRGSAFFLHVTDGTPTAGCVSIPQSRLAPLMRWLTPGSHPRILIGVV